MNKRDLDNGKILCSSSNVGRKRLQWIHTFIQHYIQYIITIHVQKKTMYSHTKI